MLRDVFYYGQKPNVHPREKPAKNLEDAREQATTEHFWIVNEYCDYTDFDWDFDFDFLPDDQVYAEDHNNVWPSQHCKDSGTWLCAKKHSDTIIYREDVDLVKRKNIKTNHWKLIEDIDESKFDFSWHPDPTSPPYIYRFGCKFYPATHKPVLEYHVEGAKNIKYMDIMVELLPNYENFKILQDIDKDSFDFSWRPDPTSPPYIYVWGNQHYPATEMPTVEYHVPGATKHSYIDQLWHVKIRKDPSKFDILEDFTDFDFSWVPHPDSPPYIYVWGNQWNKPEDKASVRYIVPGASEYKYMPERVTRKPDKTNYVIPDNTDNSKFDFSWEPNPRDGKFIYQFGTQHQKTGGPKYIVDDATEIKYIDIQTVKRLPQPDKFTVLTDFPIVDFDYSWHPDDSEEPYIYIFGNQHYIGELMPTIEYRVDGASEYKYVDNVKATIGIKSECWKGPNNVDMTDFDFSWIPHPKDPPYIYEFGTQWQKTGGPRYVVEGATEIKYIGTSKAKALPTTRNWQVIADVKIKQFDFSWHPDSSEQPYIYVFGNNKFKAEQMPTIRYVVPGATEIKYIDNIIATLDINKNNWIITQPIDESKFDFSWIPDPNDPPYIYRWGNKYISNKYKATIEYIVPGATEIKYMTDDVVVLPEYDRWDIPANVDKNSFDFTWRPDPLEPDYIYEFGTQWQKTGGPTYTVAGATEIKYVDFQKAIYLSNAKDPRWIVPDYIDASDFDFSWHPDSTEIPYIYEFGTQWQSNGGVRFEVPGATQVNYIGGTNRAKALPRGDNWIIPDGLDIDSFDFSWHPDNTAPPYVYQFGTQHQKNGGPRYTVPGATEVKFVEGIYAKRLPDQTHFKILVEHVIESFDYSWHPDNTEEPYIYIFGNQHHDARQMPTIEYRMPGAVKEKYITDIVAKLAQNKTNWIVPDNIDDTEFDYSWIPNQYDQPYIYEFNTQYQKNGGPRYVVEGASEIKYMYSDKAIAKPTSLYWQLCDMKIKSFDYSWHPDNTEQPYIYVFGNEQYSAEVMPTIKYVMPGATELKYVNTVVAKTFADMTKWSYNNNIDLDKFDFNWLPDPGSPPYIYQFGTQWQKTGGPTYTVEGATEIKYVDSQKAIRLSDKSNWIIPKDIDASEFDFSWHPDDTEPAYIYEFGTQHQKTDGPRYVVKDATTIKYIDIQSAKRLPNLKSWFIPNNIDKNSFDFSWHPDNTEEPYDYEFATIWNDVGGPVYKMPNSTQKKYIKNIQAKTISDKRHYAIKLRLETDGFDFSWVPHPESPPYIYVFGNQWNRAEKEATIEYHTPGATEYKYVHDIIAKVAEDKSNFEILRPIIENDFDFSWRPDPYDDPFIYVFGNTQYPGEVMPTVRYVVQGATEIKYVDSVVAKLATNMKNWFEHIKVDRERFDFSWVPDPLAPPYIYVFGNQWNNATIEPTLEYRVPGATEYKYIEDTIAYVLPDKSNYTILHPILEESFDFSWRPNPKTDPYIYAFGNTQYPAEKMPTVLYKIRGAKDYKYEHSQKATLAQNYERFTEIIPVDRTSFDYSWVPDPHDEPYIYVFGNQWNNSEIEPTLEYRVKNATQRKHMPQRANVLPDYTKWRELIKVRNNFDYSWRPDPTSPPYIYVFGNQWNSSEVEPTLEYRVEGATERKYINDIVAEVASDLTNWIIDEGINTDDFDFSWRPNPGSPPYIYQFGTLLDDSDGPRYMPKKNNGEIIKLQRITKQYENEFTEIPKYYITTTLEDLIEEHPDELFWALHKNINYSKFNFSWRPNIEQARYVHVFGSPDAEETQTYFVSSKLYKQGFTKFNFITEDIKAESEYLAELFIQPDIFMIDRGNIEAKERFEKLKERFPTIQKARYLNGWVDTIYRCLNKCKTDLAWILNSELDYTNFDFKYYPNPWQLKMVHIFGTQWSHWGTTYLVNKNTFAEDTKYIKTIEHLSNLNFVKNRTAKATNCLYDVYLIDHGNKETDTIQQQLSTKLNGKNLYTVPYRVSYLQTFKDILSKIEITKDQYIWVCSSVCDYVDFDLTYICDPFAKDNLHVFPSDRQKFGDTFLIDVNKLQSLINDMNLLEDYEKVNYNGHLRTRRLPCPILINDKDTHSNLGSFDFDFPYAILKTVDNIDVKVQYDEPISLWANHTKNIEILTTGGTNLVVPKGAKQYHQHDVYDYPYITKSKKIVKSKPLDIVYLSNGEIGADENYEHLLKVCKHLPNRIVRVDGVDGRVKAYHAAAEASNTPWMFTVFAKLKVDEKFDFSWQPDRLQVPKHYIFNARNPVNGLVYGHQAMIAYNKQLTINNQGRGLDFTLDDEHEVVDMLSGTANFNTDAYSTWRTAFREVIKLKSDYQDISFTRLNTWLTIANGQYAQDCLQGANDGVEYYNLVNGDIDQLRLSYEWSWLKEYYNRKYK